MKNTLLLFLNLSLTSFVYSQDWHQVESGTLNTLNTITFPSSTVGYIGGNDSLLLKTIDGGKTWNPLNYSGVDFIPSGTDDNIINLKFISETAGYMTVGPYSNGVYKTTDGGLTWSLVGPMEDALCFNYGLFFFDEDNGFLGGSDCFTGEQIHRISESGTTPTSMDIPISGAMVTSIDFWDANFGLAVGGYVSGGAILKTTDGGTSWIAITTDIDPSSIFTEVLITDENTAYIAYTDPDLSLALYESTDAGNTWHLHDGTATFYYPDFNCLHQSGNGQIFTGGSTSLEPHGIIFEKELEGDFWNYYSVYQPINSMSSYDDSIVWGVGDSGYIVVNTAPETLTISENTIKELNVKIAPNPATDWIQISHNSEIKIEEVLIYNSTGEIVYQTSKWTENKLTINNLTTGIYFVTLRTDQGTCTQKLVKY